MEEISFIGLVTSLYIACWQQLGKIANPITGKIEKSLEQAKYTIDMLVMLRDKTKGNLSKEEEKAIGEAIANLQLNYVDELNKPKEPEVKKGEKDEPAKS